MNMTSLAGTRSFYRKDRLFELLLTFWAAFDALAIATECMKTGILNRTSGNIAIQAEQFDLWIKFPALKITGAMTKNISPDGFQIIFSPTEGRTGEQIGPTMFGYVGVSMAIVLALYMEFYETHVPWLKQKFGVNRKDWPKLFYFARNVRNFVAHHGGKVPFDNASDPPASWHHFTYSPVDEGTIAVGPNRIYLGEMLVLMVEMSDELDRLGCPKPEWLIGK
jgi:hypothetical protein